MTKTKKQLRAEAVERLRDYENWQWFRRHEDPDLLMATIGDEAWSKTSWKHNRDALIDLLTDDETPAVDENQEGHETADDAPQIGLRDSREKLEADVRGFYDEHECHSFMSVEFLDVVYGWLDRQEAITASNYEYARKLDSEATVFMRKKNDELQAKVDALEADARACERCEADAVREVEALREVLLKVIA